MANATVARVGPNMPLPANPGGENESTPQSQRASKDYPLSDGPKVTMVGEGAGAIQSFAPASYPLPSGTIRTDR